MYKLSKTGGVIRTSDGANIPEDIENSDYKKYLEWVASGFEPEPAQSVEELKAEKIQVAQKIFDVKKSETILYKVGGVEYEWHADEEAITNIMGVVLLIVAGIPVPNPRYWTPVGSSTPVSITHKELIGLGAAIAARKDALFVEKKLKQRTIKDLEERDNVEDFDINEGWK